MFFKIYRSSSPPSETPIYESDSNMIINGLTKIWNFVLVSKSSPPSATYTKEEEEESNSGVREKALIDVEILMLSQLYFN